MFLKDACAFSTIFSTFFFYLYPILFSALAAVFRFYFPPEIYRHHRFNAIVSNSGVFRSEHRL